MIAMLSGKILSNSGAEIVVMTAGGVGYKVTINPAWADKWPVNSETQILIHMVVREDAQELYGFADTLERGLFLNFLSVSGIGPKTAMHLLSLGTVDEIAAAIARSDLAYLTGVSGIGQKTAERIVVELKNKVGKLSEQFADGVGGQLADVVAGLVALGYSAAEARAAIKPLDPTGKTSEQLLKEALQKIK